MQESFTEEPFKALMVGGAMTSMLNPGGAAAGTESKSRGADALQRGYEQPVCWLSQSPHPTPHPAGRAELALGLGLAFQTQPHTDRAAASQDQGSLAQQ